MAIASHITFQVNRRSRDFVGGDRRVLWKSVVMVKKVKQPKQAREVPSPSKQPRIAVDPDSYYLMLRGSF